MIAAHRQMKPLRVRVPAALNFANASPINVRGIPVLLVASDDATLAADALRHVKVKAVLLANFQSALGDAGNGLIDGSEAMGPGDRMQLAFRRQNERCALLFRPL